MRASTSRSARARPWRMPTGSAPRVWVPGCARCRPKRIRGTSMLRSNGKHTALIAALTLVGLGLTVWVFYPGVMTYDAKFVYEDVLKGFRGDWQSPVMTSLWALIDPISPGSASMFFLIAGLYWLGFGLLAATISRRSLPVALVLLLLAAAPPAFLFVGIIWRDVLFAGTWLTAAAVCFAVSDRQPAVRLPFQAVTIALIALGVLLRPNALFAAPLILAYA